MKPSEVIEQMFDEEVACEYCSINDECPHGIVCYGGPPIEPPCFAGQRDYLIDFESYCEENGIELESEE